MRISRVFLSPESGLDLGLTRKRFLFLGPKLEATALVSKGKKPYTHPSEEIFILKPARKPHPILNFIYRYKPQKGSQVAELR